MNTTPAVPTVVRAALQAAVDEEKRTITGTATLIGTAADASTGRVQFEPGSLHFPANLTNVKLCIEHDHHQAVGYATAAKFVDDRLEMTFHIPDGPKGDEALASAANHLRDGLSVGAFPEDDGARYVHGTQTLVVTSAIVREVSLTAIPAFDAARVTDVKATHQEGNPMHNTTPTTTAPEPQATAPSGVVLAAPPVAAPRPALDSVRAAARALTEMVAAGQGVDAIMAALNTTTIDDDAGTGFIGRPTWLGELWAARRTDRPLISSLTSRPLGRTTKVKGWQWETRPEVGKWAGKGTDIPSNKVKTKPIEDGVIPIAGGWDVDRMYVDLGDPDFIEALFRAAVEDYALKSEAEITTKVLAAASKITASNDLAAALVTLGTAASKIGSRVDFVSFGTDVWAKFTALKRDDVPWWITAGDRLNLSTTTADVNGLRLFVNPALAPGTILAGDGRAVTFYENDVPIRVNAVNLPKGAVDLGLFGYCGAIVNDSTALMKIEAA